MNLGRHEWGQDIVVGRGTVMSEVTYRFWRDFAARRKARLIFEDDAQADGAR